MLEPGALIGQDMLAAAAAVFAGAFVNAIAGGGSMITLPIMVLAGIPPVVANATGTGALLSGYVSSLLGRPRPQGIGSVGTGRMALLAAGGGALGGSLLLASSEAVFAALVPVLLGFGLLLFALAPRLGGLTGRAAVLGPMGFQAALLAVSTYGGYFNGGVGILLMAILALAGLSDTARANDIKNLLSAILTAGAVLFYILGGLIAWSLLWVLLPAALAGGYCGGQLAGRLPRQLFRAVILVAGTLLTIAFAWKVWAPA